MTNIFLGKKMDTLQMMLFSGRQLIKEAKVDYQIYLKKKLERKLKPGKK